MFSCVSLQVSAMKFTSEQMCEDVSHSATDCCTHDKNSNKATTEDCSGICSCCALVVAISQKVIIFQYLEVSGYLDHRTLYREGVAQSVVSKLEQPPSA